jgi:phosphatidylethanolamine/phosphatidyl-N-methylethanolamine N-methyltransferase
MIFRTAGWRRFVYTLYAPIYNVMATRPFVRMRRRSIRKLQLHPGQRVLIVGAGTGLDLNHLPADVSITAIDLAPAMLRRLRRRARRLGLAVDARVMDAQALEFPNRTFDAVILHLILAVAPNGAACAREAARVLRDGGRAVVLDKFLPEDAPAPRLLRVLAPLASCFGTELDRRLGPIIQGSGFTILSDEPAALRGMFRIVLLEKHSPAGDAA